ncbi:hypothetical protein Glove_349g79 [Diversispora epigaea]|uniref:Uncharacterized protein n=1 Tax=Diversispora epigaea TaxID=1348612 RepID=A0A397HL93_9GLOM|nr:hypothetical protein Glove_349g79 [Diversispora epigaea]
MSTSMEVLAYINFQEKNSKVTSGTATYVTSSNKKVDFSYKLFIETCQPEVEDFAVGDVVIFFGKFCYDISSDKNSAGLVLNIGRTIKYPNINATKWTLNNVPKSRPMITFSAICEQEASQIRFIITKKKEVELKTVYMRINSYGLTSKTTDLSQYYLVSYTYTHPRWNYLKFQLNKRYYISGVLDGFLEDDQQKTRMVIRATEIDFDNSLINTTSVPLEKNTDETLDLTDLITSSQNSSPFKKRKHEVSFSLDNNQSQTTSEIVNIVQQVKQKKMESSSSEEEEKQSPKTQVVEQIPYTNLNLSPTTLAQNPYYFLPINYPGMPNFYHPAALPSSTTSSISPLPQLIQPTTNYSPTPENLQNQVPSQVQPTKKTQKNTFKDVTPSYSLRARNRKKTETNNKTSPSTSKNPDVATGKKKEVERQFKI